MDEIIIKPIGTIYTPYNSREGMPIQPKGANGIRGTIVIKPEFEKGLQDLEGFSHLILIYYFHKIENYQLILKPFMDDIEHGVFSTRAPKRPNQIGFSVVKLNRIEKNILYIENVDMLNETPIIDIKPYIPDIDSWGVDKLGWLEGKSQKMGEKKSDNRFNS